MAKHHRIAISVLAVLLCLFLFVYEFLDVDWSNLRHFKNSNCSSFIPFRCATDEETFLGASETQDQSVSISTSKSTETSKNASDFDPQIQLPYEIDAVDREGSPVVTLPFGLWNVRGSIEEGHGKAVRERFYETFREMDEKLKQQSELSHGRINSSIVIYNFKGFTFWQVLSIKTVQLLGGVLKYYETNYDIQKLKHWYIINAPGYFSLFLNALRIFSSAQLLSKVEIYGSLEEQWRTVLLEQISADQLTPDYGGTRGVRGMT